MWANESLTLVINDVYNYDPTNLRSGDPVLGQAYYEHNWPIVCQRLEAAGIRLANTLNAAFANWPNQRHPHVDAALRAQLDRAVELKKANKQQKKKPVDVKKNK